MQSLPVHSVNLGNWRTTGSRNCGSAAASCKLRSRHGARNSESNHATLRLLPGPFPRHASRANFANRAMADAPDDGGCRTLYRSLTFIARLSGASTRDSRSAWPRIAIFPS